MNLNRRNAVTATGVYREVSQITTLSTTPFASYHFWSLRTAAHGVDYRVNLAERLLTCGPTLREWLWWCGLLGPVGTAGRLAEFLEIYFIETVFYPGSVIDRGEAGQSLQALLERTARV